MDGNSKQQGRQQCDQCQDRHEKSPVGRSISEDMAKLMQTLLAAKESWGDDEGIPEESEKDHEGSAEIAGEHCVNGERD